MQPVTEQDKRARIVEMFAAQAEKSRAFSWKEYEQAFDNVVAVQACREAVEMINAVWPENDERKQEVIRRLRDKDWNLLHGREPAR